MTNPLEERPPSARGIFAVYFTSREAAAYLHTALSTLAKRRLYGKPPRFTRIGRAIRYRKEDLDDFMASGLVSSTSDRGGKP